MYDEKIKICFAVDAFGLAWFIHDFGVGRIADTIFDGTSVNDNLSTAYPEKVIPDNPGCYIGDIVFTDISGWTSNGYECDCEIEIQSVEWCNDGSAKTIK